MSDLRDDLRSAYHERDDLWFESLLAKVPVPPVEPKFDPLTVSLPHLHPDFVAAWAEWVKYRRARRLTLTEVTVRKQLMMLNEYPTREAIQILNASIQNGWQGLFPERSKLNGKADSSDAVFQNEMIAAITGGKK